MFCRVAACSIAAFFLVSPALSSGETDAFADVSAATTSISIETERDRGQVLIPSRNSDQASDQTQDSETKVKVAALDPAETSPKSRAAAGRAVNPSALAAPFGLDTVPVTRGGILLKWKGVQADIQAEYDVLSRCRANAELCPAAARKFLAIIAQGREQTGRARIGIINRAINLAIRPMSDLAQWGVIDRWSGPLETLTTGLGDCEDYAIAKYVALKEAGVASEDVKLLVVRDLVVDEEHAVVAARLNGAWIILDNRWLTLVQDSEMRRTIPIFVLDQTGVKQFARTPTPDGRRALTPRQSAASPAAL
jgi:predicted transglutaminase-like cysteine proteinase